MTETQKIPLFCSLHIDNKKQENFCVKICKNYILEVASNKKGNFNPLILFPNVFTTRLLEKYIMRVVYCRQ